MANETDGDYDSDCALNKEETSGLKSKSPKIRKSWLRNRRLQAIVNKIVIVGPLICATCLIGGIAYGTVRVLRNTPQEIPVNHTIPLCSSEGYCPVDSRLIQLNTTEGYSLLADGKPHSFFQLVNHFASQQSLISCGVATAVVILNSMHIEKPATQCADFGGGNQCFRSFTEKYLVEDNPCTKEVTKDIRKDPGLELHQVAKIFECFDLEVEMFYGNVTSSEKLRSIFEKVYEPNNFVAVQYNREEVFQIGGGHFSPLGAFNKKHDRLLIMDVFRFAYPPVWIQSEAVMHSVSTTTSLGYSRGVLLVRGPSYPATVTLS